MAYGTETEDYNSREYNWNAEGITFIRIFTVLWTELYDGTFDYQPGYPLTSDGTWTANPYGLYITNISANFLTNTKAKVQLLYSTRESRMAMKKQPNQKTSWEESFDIGLQVNNESTLWKTSASSWVPVSWANMWAAGANSDKEAPALSVYTPEESCTITAYADTLYIHRIMENIGKINSNKFMQDYLGFDQGSGIVHDIPANYNDINCWMFMACPIQRIRFDCWEYRFNFALCPRFVYGETWNTPHGISTTLYDTYDFSNILSGMRATDSMYNPGA